MEEFNLDGFRFNEVTRMLYHNPEESMPTTNLLILLFLFKMMSLLQSIAFKKIASKGLKSVCTAE